jgi:hypothetical protein
MSQIRSEGMAWWFGRAAFALLIMAFLISLPLSLLLSSGAQTATLDSLDIQRVGDELVAVGEGKFRANIRLELKERILWQGTKGIVGVTLTNHRFLAVSTASADWKQMRLQSDEAESAQVQLGANIAVLVTGQRLLAFDGVLGRLTEERLVGQEALITSGVNEHVGIVVTTRRVIGLASRSEAPVDLALKLSESYESSKVLDTVARVQTSHRVLVFDGSSGIWTEEKLPLD